jgi:UPF0176 protein
MSITIATFYHFAPVPDAAALQPLWKAFLVANNVTGTLLVAPEGINATIAGPAQGVEAVLAMLKQDLRFQTLTHKTSYAETNPFPRTKVRLKKETIPLGVTVDPTNPGQYVKPQDWNALISQPGVITVDTRNDYEVAIGQFQGAQNPNTRTFKELPAWLEENLPAKTTPIAMYCTGGIRCEKSTAYLKAQGYTNVYHLEGGILKYLEDVPEQQSLWQGACYVFDDRVAVTHSLAPASQYQVCRHCNMPVNAADVRRMFSTSACPHCGGSTAQKNLSRGAGEAIL